MPLTPDQRDALRVFGARLDAAQHGEKGAIEAEAKRLYGWSRHSFYRNLKAAGWDSGRKPRTDKGTTSVPETSLTAVGAMTRESLRENGKQTMFLPTACSVAEQSGIVVPVGARQMGRLLKARRLDIASQRVAEPVVRLRAPHPNHTHEVDPSLCLLFYMKGEQRLVRDSEFYKNKLDRFVKDVKLKVWRYVLYDKASGALAVRYFEAAGETQANLFEFLHWAWRRKDELTLFGAPVNLLWDKGSANTATAIQRWLAAMEVNAIAHEAGNARAKGGVENGNNLVETMFECRLKFEPVHSVEELNAAAWAWCEAFNANRLPRQDTRLRRVGMLPTARYDLWHRIVESQVRIPPALDVCQSLMAGKDTERKVRRDLTITFRHPQADRTQAYVLRGLAGICAEDVVNVQPLVFGNQAILVEVAQAAGEPIRYRVEPERDLDEYGQPLSAPEIGARYAAVADTAIEQAARRMDEAAFPERTADEIKKARAKGVTPFDGKLDALSHLQDIERVNFLPRRGTDIAIQASTFETIPLSHFEAAKALRALGVERPDLHPWLVANWPDGVKDAELPDIAARLKGERTGPRLQAVGA